MLRLSLSCFLAIATLGSGCATVLRSSTRDLTLYGPEDLKLVHDGRELTPVREGTERGQARYSATLSKDLRQIEVRAGGVEARVPLETTVSVGWVVADVLLGGVLGIVVDMATGNWNNYADANATPRLVAAGYGKDPARLAARPASVPARTAQDAIAATRARSDEALGAGPRVQPASTAPALPRTVVERGKLAVLDLRNFAADLKPEDARYFADVIRGATLRIAPALEVITRENLLVLLKATGTDAASCEGECEVDTGRRIGADAVISGEILKVGTRLKISLKLHETRDGRLLSTAVASGRTLDELDESAQAAGRELLVPAR